MTTTPFMPAGPCPECAAGKHGNCDGHTWDEATDGLVTCPCKKAGHAERHDPDDDGTGYSWGAR